MTVAAFLVTPYGSAIIPPALTTPRKRSTRTWVVPVDSILENFHRVSTASSSSISGPFPNTATISTPDISSDVSSFIIATTTSSTTTFEPIVPDTTALLGFGSIVVLCAVAAWVWANQVVPVARTNLARSKKNGPVREYLDELRTSKDDEYSNNKDDEAVVAISSNATVASAAETTTASTTTTARTTKRDRSLERWLFTDWLEKAPSSKPSALPVLKNAKWNSGDNPVLAATALILLGVLCTAVTERIATTISL